MNATAERYSLDELPADLAALIPDGAPELVGVSWISELLSITTQTVIAAIKSDKLPALPIPGNKGVASYAIRPRDAVRLWGRKTLRRRERELEMTS